MTRHSSTNLKSKSSELGDDATYPMRGLGSISFHMPSSDVLEFNDVLFVTRLMKNLLSISCMVKLKCKVAFEG